MIKLKVIFLLLIGFAAVLSLLLAIFASIAVFTHLALGGRLSDHYNLSVLAFVSGLFFPLFQWLYHYFDEVYT